MYIILLILLALPSLAKETPDYATNRAFDEAFKEIGECDNSTPQRPYTILLGESQVSAMRKIQRNTAEEIRQFRIHCLKKKN